MSITFNNSFFTNGLNVEKAYRPPQDIARDCSQVKHSHSAQLVTDKTKKVSDVLWNNSKHSAMNPNHRTARFATPTYKKNISHVTGYKSNEALVKTSDCYRYFERKTKSE